MAARSLLLRRTIYMRDGDLLSVYHIRKDAVSAESAWGEKRPHKHARLYRSERILHGLWNPLWRQWRVGRNSTHPHPQGLQHELRSRQRCWRLPQRDVLLLLCGCPRREGGQVSGRASQKTGRIWCEERGICGSNIDGIQSSAEMKRYSPEGCYQ